MARTALLSSEELNFLRKEIAERFHYSNAYAQELKPNAFLPNYEELKQSMDAALPDMATSISLKRLRKLFYDTNVKRRGIKKAIRPGFGLDFLDACYLYITDKKHNRQSYLLKNKDEPPASGANALLRKRLIFFSFGLLIIIMIAVIWLILLQKPASYYQDFNFSGAAQMMETLQNEGWMILDLDSNYLNKQDKPGHLALYTLEGDYWVKPNENPIIKNLFVKEIDCKNCFITTKIYDFCPYQSHQQVGIFLFDKNLDPQNHIRYTFCFAELASHHRHCLQGIHIKNGIVEQFLFKPLHENHPFFEGAADGVWLRIEFHQNGNYSLLQHTGYEWVAFSEEAKYITDFKPKYVGIGAFQGFTEHGNINRKLQADTIPAYIDYIYIEPFPR